MPSPPAILASIADPASWEDVPRLTAELFKQAAELTYHTLTWSQELPPEQQALCSVYWMPLRKKASLVVSTPPTEPPARPSLPSAQVVSWGLTPPDDAWIPLHRGDSWDRFSLKQARPFLPSPLAVTLAGGALGAGLGYAGGWLGEKLIPDKYREPGALRRRAAALGGMIGAAPGAYYWSLAARQPDISATQALTTKWPWQHKLTGPETQDLVLNDVFGTKRASVTDREQTSALAFLQSLEADLAEQGITVREDFSKQADYAGATLPTLLVDEFNRVVWRDPSTPPLIKATTTGLTTAAQAMNGGSPWVSPLDIAQVAMGAGAGLMSGLVVGKTLGALAGLSPYGQQQLQQVGLWSGVLNSVVPKIFGQ
jgi:hypothetical protein